MNFSTMTVSFPIDEETYLEVYELCNAAEQADLVSYTPVMNLLMARDPKAKGFFVLMYNDDKNELVGVASAVDMIGLHTYEWSLLIDPMYRQIGLGEALYNVLKKALEMRGSVGDLGVMMAGGNYGAQFLRKMNYAYSFSEAMLEAPAAISEEAFPFEMREYREEDAEALCEIFASGFGDTVEESMQLIMYNHSTPGIFLWVAERDGHIIGTVSTRQEGDGHWVTALAVHPIAQGQGIGSEIIRWVKNYVAKCGEKTVMLDVEIDNEKAIAIYEKNGFMVSSEIHYFVNQ